jgi:hypothetical protein
MKILKILLAYFALCDSFAGTRPNGKNMGKLKGVFRGNYFRIKQ